MTNRMNVAPGDEVTSRQKHFQVDVAIQAEEVFLVEVDAADETQAREIAQRLVEERAYVGVNSKRTRRDMRRDEYEGRFAALPQGLDQIDVDAGEVRETDEDGEPLNPGGA